MTRSRPDGGEGVAVDGLDLDLHRQIYPARWLTVRSAWTTFRRAFIIVPVAFGVNWLTGDGLVMDRVDMALALGWIAHAFMVALDPPVPVNHRYLDKRTQWLRFRAWWSK